MQHTLRVGNDNKVAADHRCCDPAQVQLVLFPQAGPAGQIQCVNSAFVIGDVEVALVDGQADRTGHLARPGDCTVGEVEAGNTALKGHGTDQPSGQRRGAGDVGDAVQFRGALGHGDRAIPVCRTVGCVDGDQLAIGEAGQNMLVVDQWRGGDA